MNEEDGFLNAELFIIMTFLYNYVQENKRNFCL